MFRCICLDIFHFHIRIGLENIVGALPFLAVTSLLRSPLANLLQPRSRIASSFLIFLLSSVTSLFDLFQRQSFGITDFEHAICCEPYKTNQNIILVCFFFISGLVCIGTPIFDSRK